MRSRLQLRPSEAEKDRSNLMVPLLPLDALLQACIVPASLLLKTADAAVFIKSKSPSLKEATGESLRKPRLFCAMAENA